MRPPLRQTFVFTDSPSSARSAPIPAPSVPEALPCRAWACEESPVSASWARSEPVALIASGDGPRRCRLTFSRMFSGPDERKLTSLFHWGQDTSPTAQHAGADEKTWTNSVVLRLN